MEHGVVIPRSIKLWPIRAITALIYDKDIDPLPHNPLTHEQLAHY